MPSQRERILAFFQANPDSVFSISDVRDAIPGIAAVASLLSTLTWAKQLRRVDVGVYRLESAPFALPVEPAKPMPYTGPGPAYWTVRGVEFYLTAEEMEDYTRRAERIGETIGEFLDSWIGIELEQQGNELAEKALRWARECDDEMRADERSVALDAMMGGLTDHGCAKAIYRCGCCGDIELPGSDYPVELKCPLCILAADRGPHRRHGYCDLEFVQFTRTGRLWELPPYPQQRQKQIAEHSTFPGFSPSIFQSRKGIQRCAAVVKMGWQCTNRPGASGFCRMHGDRAERAMVPIPQGRGTVCW